VGSSYSCNVDMLWWKLRRKPNGFGPTGTVRTQALFVSLVYFWTANSDVGLSHMILAVRNRIDDEVEATNEF